MSISDSRRQVAEHNLQAILDGAERLLRRGDEPSISAVASEARVSRPTVYAHFEDRRALLEALVERTVRQTMEAISSSEPGSGPASAALQRLIAASWQQIADHNAIAHAAAGELSAESMRAAHQSARSAIRKLIQRGRRDGSFRSDLPLDWLVTASLALVHAAADEVRAGQVKPDAALRMLSTTIDDLLRKQKSKN